MMMDDIACKENPLLIVLQYTKVLIKACIHSDDPKRSAVRRRDFERRLSFAVVDQKETEGSHQDNRPAMAV